MNAMQLRRDLAAARKLISNLVRSRRNRRAVARLAPRHPQPAAGSIQIVVYFADTAVNMYQVRQWYAPLAELAGRWPVAIIARSPGAVLKLWDEAPVPSVYLRGVVELERFFAEQDLRIVLYVNQNTRNFQMFRWGARLARLRQPRRIRQDVHDEQPVQGIRLQLCCRSSGP